jgi:hypothetical protein
MYIMNLSEALFRIFVFSGLNEEEVRCRTCFVLLHIVHCLIYVSLQVLHSILQPALGSSCCSWTTDMFLISVPSQDPCPILLSANRQPMRGDSRHQFRD